MKKIIHLAIFGILLTACEKLFIEKDPDNNPESNFEIFWKSFDKHYALFQHKNIDWDSIYNIYRPMINSNTTDNQLYNVLLNMTFELKDRHVYLYPISGSPANYDSKAGYPVNSRQNAGRYLVNQKSLGPFKYADINNANLGYIYIADFEGDVNLFDLYQNDEFEKIDQIINEFEDKKGLIIDVRDNNGGNDFLSKIVASRFANKKQIFSIQYWRNGENHDDFISKERYIEPKGEVIYTNPVTVLINRETYSAAEGFVEMMMLFPQVTLIGGNTGGGAGGTSKYELPNGLTYNITTKFGTSSDGSCYEGIGIAPDIEVTNTETEITNGIDRILEEAIEHMNNE